MSWFGTKLDTYDKTEAKVLKQAIDAGYAAGNSGFETNTKAVAARAAVKADIDAMTRTLALFNVADNPKLHKQINERLCQENKWLKHYDRVIEANKQGFEKLKLSSEKLVAEAVAAAEVEFEKKLRAKKSEGNLQSKVDGKNDGKNVDPKFKQPEGGNRNDQDRNKNDNNQDRNKNDNNQNNKGKATIVDTLVVKEIVIVKEKKGKKNKNKGAFFQQAN